MSDLASLPYARQSVDDDDIAAVVAALRSDWLTQGPGVAQFEEAFAHKTGAKHAVAVNSGTAALHAAMHALAIGPGDEVIVPSITFTATANCVVFQGGVPVFADVDVATGLIDPSCIREKITKRTKAIVAVDYAGHPCDYDALQQIADDHGLALVADACHSLGATYNGQRVGSLAKVNCFSFHPVKHIATGEGGMVTTEDDALAQVMRDFRTHGITRDRRRFRGLRGDTGARAVDSQSATAEIGPWYYEMLSLGYNYRLSDIHCALGHSQLAKLDRFVARRREIAVRYGAGLQGLRHCTTPHVELWANPSWHLYPLRISFDSIGKTRTQFMAELRARGIETQVHYIPVCLQPFYRERFDLQPDLCPNSNTFYAQELSIPMYPDLNDDDVARVIAALRTVLSGSPEFDTRSAQPAGV